MALRTVTPPVRVGLIGAGLIGQTHSLMLRQVADASEGSVRVAAVHDPIAEQAERIAGYWPGARAAASAREILDDAAIDAVWICTPTRFHRELCIAAAAAGKHVFCEKPVAMNSGEAAEMQAALEAAGVMSQVGLVLRFSPVYTVIRQMLADAGAGRVLGVTMRDDQDFPTRGVHASAWRNDPSLTAGGTLIEHSVHDFDLMTWMFGPVARLFCLQRNFNGAPGVEDFAATQFEFAAGFCGQMTSVWHRMLGRPSNRRLEVFAENLFVATDHDMLGSIGVQRGDGPEETIAAEEVMRRFEAAILAERPWLRPLRNWLAVPYAAEDATFVAALTGHCAPDPEFAAGVAAQRLVEAAYRSARSGLVVTLKDDVAL
jgi:myo-inositol 2-dehydrogenase/D-chiro-inositol 1-dehydrogenase